MLKLVHNHFCYLNLILPLFVSFVVTIRFLLKALLISLSVTLPAKYYSMATSPLFHLSIALSHSSIISIYISNTISISFIPVTILFVVTRSSIALSLSLSSSFSCFLFVCLSLSSPHICYFVYFASFSLSLCYFPLLLFCLFSI